MMESREEDQARGYLQGQGIDYCHGTNWREVREQLNRQDIIETPETLIMFKEMLDSLSKEAREVVGIVLSTPQELIEALFVGKKKGKGRLNRNQLRMYLRYRGWKHLVIESVFGELRKKI